jgi:hypothetical protein
MSDPQSPLPSPASSPTSFRATICAWLEADGWSVSPHLGGLLPDEAAGREFRWLAVAHRDGSPLVLGEPTAGGERLVLSHHFVLPPADRARLEALTGEERSDLAWELFRHLNLLLVDYEVDRPVPREVLLTVTVVREGLTRDRLLRDVLRLAAAHRLVCLIFERAVGSLLLGPPAPVTH